MAVDCRHLLNRLEEMAFEEQRAIRAEVDAAFFIPGWRSSPDLISASAVAIAAGLRRVTARIADEAWAVAEKKDPVFMADAGKVAAHLRIRMVGYYRQRLMSDRGGWSPEVTVKACGDLSETLSHICDKMVDQLAHRSMPLPPALLPDLPSPAPAGRGAAGPEAPCLEAAGSAPPAPTVLVPPGTTTAGRLSPQHLSSQRPLRQNPFRRRPLPPIPAPPGAATAASAAPIIGPLVPAAPACAAPGVAPLIIAAPAPVARPVPHPQVAKQPARPPPAPPWSARSRRPANDHRPVKALISSGCRPCSRRSVIPSGRCGSIACGAGPSFAKSQPSKPLCSAKIPIGVCC